MEQTHKTEQQNFEDLTNFIATIDKKEKEFEKLKEKLRLLYKEIERDEARLVTKKSKALKIYQQISSFNKE